MWDSIFSFFTDNYPTLLWVLVGVAVTWQASKVYNRFIKVEDNNKDLPCAHHGEDIRELKNATSILENINKSIADIKSNIGIIERYIIKEDPESFDTMLMMKHSPYRLTDYGLVLLDDSGAKECVDNSLDYFCNSIKEKNPLVALDVEQYALVVLNENLKSERFNGIKNYVFAIPDPTTLTSKKNGEKIDISIKLGTVLNVMSIYLRDKYFEKHPEIDISSFFEANEIV